MNLIDLLFLLIFVGILALGFFQGMIRVGVLILAFYLSTVLSSLYFLPFGDFLHENFGGPIYASRYIGFFMMMIFFNALLAAAGLYTFRYAEMPGRLQYLDRVVGVLLSLIFAALIIGVLSSLMWQLFIISGGGRIDLPLFRMLGGSVRSSFMISYFATVILPDTYNVLQPILPSGARMIFELPS